MRLKKNGKIFFFVFCIPANKRTHTHTRSDMKEYLYNVCLTINGEERRREKKNVLLRWVN